MDRINLSRLLYYISFILIIFSDFLSRTLFKKLSIYDPLYKASIIAACLMLVVKFFIDTHTKKEIISYSAFLVVGLAVTINVGSYYVLLPIILLLISLRNIDIEKIIKIWVIEIIIMMLIVALSYYQGILGESPRLSLRSDGFIRRSLGYEYSTFSANYFLHLSVFYIYMRKNKIRLLELIVMVLISSYLFTITDTNSAYIFNIVVIVLAFLIRFNKRNKPISIINKYIVPFSVLLVGVSLYIYRSGMEIGDELNKLLTGRLSLGSDAWDIYGITLLGQKIRWIVENEWLSQLRYDYVDSSYLNILFSYGLIVVIFIIIGYSIVGSLEVSNNIYYSLMILIIALHSAYDPQLLEISANPSILFLGYLFLNSAKRRNVVEDFDTSEI